jgi:hypothetical protein
MMGGWLDDSSRRRRSVLNIREKYSSLGLKIKHLAANLTGYHDSLVLRREILCLDMAT